MYMCVYILFLHCGSDVNVERHCPIVDGLISIFAVLICIQIQSFQNALHFRIYYINNIGLNSIMVRPIRTFNFEL